MLRLVVPRKTMDTTLNQNQAEFRVLVLAVDLEVLANGDSLFDEVIQVLGYGRGEAWSD